MNTSIGTTRVEDVMITKIVTVAENETMEDVAKIFEQHDINCAPVVRGTGECVGIISNHDLARYEAARIEVNHEIKYGHFYNLSKYGNGPTPRIGVCFNDVSFHMTKALQTAEPHDPLSKVARTMCNKHIHQLVILDDERKPIGLISSLDILGFVTGEPVCRKAKC